MNISWSHTSPEVGIIFLCGFLVFGRLILKDKPLCCLFNMGDLFQRTAIILKATLCFSPFLTLTPELILILWPVIGTSQHLGGFLDPMYLFKTINLTHYLLNQPNPKDWWIRLSLTSMENNAIPIPAQVWATSKMTLCPKCEGGHVFQIMTLGNLYNFQITEKTKNTMTGRAVQLLQSYQIMLLKRHLICQYGYVLQPKPGSGSRHPSVSRGNKILCITWEH